MQNLGVILRLMFVNTISENVVTELKARPVLGNTPVKLCKSRSQVYVEDDELHQLQHFWKNNIKGFKLSGASN